MYAALVTRPDIAFAVTALCQFMSQPSVAHWQAAKRVMRYLKGTQHYELTYGSDSGKQQQLYGYSDSDWGNDVNDRRSFTGWVFLLHDGAVSLAVMQAADCGTVVSGSRVHGGDTSRT